MNNKEEFERWARCMGYTDEFDVPLMKYAAHDGWNARQPEIDALIREREEWIKKWFATAEENAALKAEVERLRDLLPMTPEAMISFIRNNYDCMEPIGENGKPQGDLSRVRYSLTVHDLLSAFSDLNAPMKETK